MSRNGPNIVPIPAAHRQDVESLARHFSKSALSQFAPAHVRMDGSTEIQTIAPTVLARARLDAVNLQRETAPRMSGDVADAVRLGARNPNFQAWLRSPVGAAAKQGLADHGFRTDSVGGGIEGGLFFAYQLSHIQGRLAAQPYAPLNGRKLFNVNAEAGNGAKQYVIRRVFKAGSAQWIDGTSVNTQNSNPNVAEVATNIRYASAGFQCSVLDMASAEFGDFLLQDNGVAGALRGLEELDNSTIWYGDTGMNLWGVTAHPDMPEAVSPTTFTSSVSFDTMNGILIGFLNTVLNNNNNAFTPDHVVFSSRLYTFMSSKLNTLGNLSLLQSFKQTAMALYGIPESAITFARELNDVGPSGEQGMFVYSKKNPDDGQIISTGGPVAVPVQFSGMNVIQNFYQGIGGYVAVNPGANLVAWIMLG